MLRSNLILYVVVCGLFIQSGCKPKSGYQESPPPEVRVVKPIVKTVPIFLEENGETEAVEEAVVEARVKGILGPLIPSPDPGNGVTRVKKGDELFKIAPKEFKVAEASAAADLGSAKAEKKAAMAALGVSDAAISSAEAKRSQREAEKNRLKGLGNAVARSEFELAEADWKTSEADVKGAIAAKKADEAKVTNAEAKVEKAEADLEQAKLKVEWTKVLAPIDGRITKTLVKEGNIVDDGTPLIEIVKNDPIWANFNINERFLLDLERQSNLENNRRDLSLIKVELQRSGDIDFPFKGHLDYFDPRIDQDTGTLQLRAVFDNPLGESNLLPGLFVRVRVQVGEYEDALLIPEMAIGRDQVGTFVYVVGPDQKADRKNVVLGAKHKEELIVIESGLDPNDSVIVGNLQRVRQGIEVDPR